MADKSVSTTPLLPNDPSSSPGVALVQLHHAKKATATRQATAKGLSIEVLMRYKACVLKLAIIVCSDWSECSVGKLEI